MKIAEIKELSTQEIIERIQEERSSYTKLKFGHAVSAIDNPLTIRVIRKTIARLQTELRSREIANQVTQEASK